MSRLRLVVPAGIFVVWALICLRAFIEPAGPSRTEWIGFASTLTPAMIAVVTGLFGYEILSRRRRDDKRQEDTDDA